MAVVETSNTKRLVGLSTDTKPSAPIGSEFWESDTGKTYRCYDGTNWAQVYSEPSTAGTAVLGKVGVDQTTVGTTDHVTADVRANGTALLTPNVFKDLSALAVGTIATAWTPATGKKFRLMGGCLSPSAAGSILFEDNAAGADKYVIRTPKLLADTPFLFDLGNGILSATANNVLKMTGSVNPMAVTGYIYGREES